MAMLVVLLETEDGEGVLGSRAVNSLAHLGITSVAVLRDARTMRIVFD